MLIGQKRIKGEQKWNELLLNLNKKKVLQCCVRKIVVACGSRNIKNSIWSTLYQLLSRITKLLAYGMDSQHVDELALFALMRDSITKVQRNTGE